MGDPSNDRIWKQLARISREIDDELSLLHDIHRRMNMSHDEIRRRFDRIARKRSEYDELIATVRTDLLQDD